MTLTPEPPDAVLADRSANGDDRAFALLVRHYKEPIYRLLRRYLGDSDEAYEATHEAFIAAWRALPRFDRSRPFGPWLKTIAINKARDRGRRIAIRRFIFPSSLSTLGNSPKYEDAAVPADELLIQQETVTALDQAIAALPKSLKEPLILAVFDGLSHQDAAKILGISAKAVEVRIYRAKRSLKDALG